jgi:membrane-associated phospholipid phosphatase
MDFFIQNGINWIVMIQGLGAWLEAPMRFFSFLGSEEFFLLILPALYWCINTELGLRVGIMLLTSTSLNHVFKVALVGPRPYWVSARVLPLAAETSFGVPSGHSQISAGVWGISAAYLRKPWAWITAVSVVVLIGFSRMYLGVHFPHDVLSGWLLGAVTVWAFATFWDRVAAWLKAQTFGRQVAVAFIISMFWIALSALAVAAQSGFVMPEEWLTNAARVGDELPDPVTLSGAITPAGTLFGLALGLAWMTLRGGYQASGPATKRALRYVVGVIGLLILWFGLGLVFPRGESILPYILRYLRYVLVGFWVSGGAPWIFYKFNLAEAPKR